MTSSNGREEERAALAHELNTPIAVIAGYAEILVQRLDDAKHREAASQIKEAAERLRSAVQRLVSDGETS